MPIGAAWRALAVACAVFTDAVVAVVAAVCIVARRVAEAVAAPGFGAADARRGRDWQVAIATVITAPGTAA